MLVMMLAVGIGWATVRPSAASPPRPVIVYHMMERMQNEQCVPVTPDDIRAGAFMEGKHQLVDVATSMLYHMASRKLSGICAQHVGVPICYCTLDLTRASPTGKRLPSRALRHPETSAGAASSSSSSSADVSRKLNAAEAYLEDEILHLFDPQIVGASRRMVLTTEANAFCRERHSARRHESVYASFYDRTGEPYELLFNGTHAINVQHALEIHAGMVSCGEDKIDLTQRAILQRLERVQDTLDRALRPPATPTYNKKQQLDA
jgi:peptide deformylase